MYNQDIYNKLEEKFQVFNMPLICEGIAEMFKLMAEESPNNDMKYEATWWTSAIERANNSINK